MKRFYPLFLIILVFIVWYYRQENSAQEVTLRGETMGTTYSIKYIQDKPVDYKPQVDSILIDFNNSLSTYIPDSEISRFNLDSILIFETEYFYQVLNKSSEVYAKTNGAFDPTVMPLVNFWGFGPERSKGEFDSKRPTVDSLLNFVGYDLILYDQRSVSKARDGVQLDFSAIAKGYGVDVVALFLESKGIENYFVEIGGEVRGLGLNKEGVPWRIGIEDPTSGLTDRSSNAIASLDNRSMATSGNYRNFYIENGVKYAHTIDPKTGFPVEHTLLSASVFAPDCMTADAYATAFMVMGKEKAIEISNGMEDLDIFLIYDSGDGSLSTYSSPGVENLIVEVE